MWETLHRPPLRHNGPASFTLYDVLYDKLDDSSSSPSSKYFWLGWEGWVGKFGLAQWRSAVIVLLRVRNSQNHRPLHGTEKFGSFRMSSRLVSVEIHRRSAVYCHFFVPNGEVLLLLPI